VIVPLSRYALSRETPISSGTRHVERQANGRRAILIYLDVSLFSLRAGPLGPRTSPADPSRQKPLPESLPPATVQEKFEVHDPGNIDTMNISNGTVSGEVEYTEHQDGTWSFKLALDDDPVQIESLDNFPTRELAQEQVNYELQAASLRVAEG
jgi:hypothetical protein